MNEKYNHNIDYLKLFDKKVENGLLFIPDISGFTKFVRTTDMLTGKLILQELLSTIIDNNEMKLNVSEIEGDAILFYRLGPAPNFNEIFSQFKLMSEAYENKRRELESIFFQPLDISLKVIAHYGPMVGLKVGPFTKLYGEVVVQAHALLKNQITIKNYLLLTKSVIEASGCLDDLAHTHHWFNNNFKDKNNDLNDSSYTFFEASEKQIESQVA